MSAIGAWFYAWLQQDADVPLLIGSGTSMRAWPGGAEQDKPAPYLTYTVVSDVAHQHLRGRAGINRARLQVDCESNRETGYADVQALAAAILGTTPAPKIDGYRGTLAGINVQGCHLLDPGRRDGYTPPQDASGHGWHMVSFDLDIWYDE